MDKLWEKVALLFLDLSVFLHLKSIWNISCGIVFDGVEDGEVCTNFTLSVL
jgi:hypothetical protein